jgi:hypothetical protein
VFNEKKLSKTTIRYVPKIRGKFIYLMRTLYNGELEHVCRLEYDGYLESMSFAIYRYSIEKYDPSEMFYDGREHEDGTLEGAMKAGLVAYPIDDIQDPDMLLYSGTSLWKKIFERLK